MVLRDIGRTGGEVSRLKYTPISPVDGGCRCRGGLLLCTHDPTHDRLLARGFNCVRRCTNTHYVRKAVSGPAFEMSHESERRIRTSEEDSIRHRVGYPNIGKRSKT